MCTASLSDAIDGSLYCCQPLMRVRCWYTLILLYMCALLSALLIRIPYPLIRALPLSLIL